MATQRGERGAGFTLVELMIVVAIVAVLAGIAVVAYTRHIKNGRLVSARAFIARIQAAQETYFQQNGTYCEPGGAAVNFDPPLSAPEPRAKPWNATTVHADWQQLGARPEGGYSYMAVYVDASDPGASHALSGSAATLQIPSQPNTGDAGVLQPHPWYYIIGHLDLDGTGGYAGNGGCSALDITNPPACTVLWTTSARAEIVVRNQGN